MELLSPAGNMDCLVAAIQNGADAVYFGGGNFNARRMANNFSGNELIRAVDYCHERAVRAYITLNTLLFDREFASAMDFTAELYRIGVDAVIVQDLGLAKVLKREFPELELHASTQMGIHNLQGLKYCKSAGITRAVLAREMGLERIKSLSNNSDVEIETFVHGALCMSFSGSCLYSSMAGERSGNRGTCAQPCRKHASVSGRPGAKDFCLSTNDICMLDMLSDLKDAGVKCIKIEGRMKKSEYVATVTRCYRAALDGADEQELKKLKAETFEIFNRGEFNTAHFYGDSVKTNGVGSSKPGSELLKKAEESVRGEKKKLLIGFQMKLRVGEPARLSAGFVDFPCIFEKEHIGAIVQKAKTPQRHETYAERLQKLGDTPFAMKYCGINMESDCYISAADLNALRREVCEALLNKMHVRKEIPEYSALDFKESIPAAAHGIGVYARVRNAKSAGKAFKAGADYVGIHPIDFSQKELEELRELKTAYTNLILIVPNVLATSESERRVNTFLSSGVFRGVETNNIGQWNMGAELPVRIAGIGMNTLNSRTAAALFEVGYTHIMPSPELNEPQLKQLSDDCNERLILSVHGKVPVMQLMHCPVKEHLGCKACKGNAGVITDEEGREFILANTRFEDHCLVTMLNCDVTDLIDILNKMPPCAGYCLSFIGEDEEAIAERIDALKRSHSGEIAAVKLPKSTRGHWNRKVD